MAETKPTVVINKTTEAPKAEVVDPASILDVTPETTNVLGDSIITSGSTEAAEQEQHMLDAKAAAEETSALLNEKVSAGEEITYRVVQIGNVMSMNPNAVVIAEGLSFADANARIENTRNMFVEAE